MDWWITFLLERLRQFSPTAISDQKRFLTWELLFNFLVHFYTTETHWDLLGNCDNYQPHHNKCPPFHHDQRSPIKRKMTLDLGHVAYNVLQLRLQVKPPHSHNLERPWFTWLGRGWLKNKKMIAFISIVMSNVLFLFCRFWNETEKLYRIISILSKVFENDAVI